MLTLQVLDESQIAVPPNEVPKKITLLDNNNILLITETGVLHTFNIKSQQWTFINKHDDLRKYVLMEISECRNLISLAGINLISIINFGPKPFFF